jgi:hypothetical protein
VILISTYDEQHVADMIAASAAVGFVCKSSLSRDAIRASSMAVAMTAMSTTRSTGHLDQSLRVISLILHILNSVAP